MYNLEQEFDTLFPGGSEVKVSACNAGDLGLIPGLERSPGEGTGNPLQDSCLENPIDGEAWWAPVRGVARSRTQLGNFTFTFFPSLSISLVAQTVKCLPPMQETRVRSLGWEDPLEKERAIHPSILAWEIHGQRSLAAIVREVTRVGLD